MNFTDWLVSKGHDPETLTAAARQHLEAIWRAEINPAPAPAPAPARLPVAAVVPEVQTPVSGSPNFDADVQAIEAEAHRQAYIREAGRVMMQRYTHDLTKLGEIKTLVASAIADKKTNRQGFDLALMRLDRYAGPAVFAPAEQQVTDAVIEAAVCKAGGLENREKQFDARTLEAADRHFRHGLGLQDLVGLFARRSGWRGTSVKAALNSPDLLRAAFRQNGDASPYDLQAADAGPSTYSLPNILGNIANKFLRVGFESVDSAWRSFCATRPVNDFKQITTAGLTGSLIYDKVPAGGELHHGDIGEVKYNNQADTYGRMLGIDRRDLINDDLGALTTAGRRLGRGGALKLNDIIWTVFLNNSSFFTAGNNNVTSGAGSALSLTSLGDLDRVFRLQTDPDGMPLGIFPQILLVPTALRITALNLMNSTITVATNTGTSTTLSPNSNVLAGAYTVVSSPYMSNSAYTGNSTTAWYLLASPADMPVIEVCFLNGIELPTVQTTEADFNTLGIALRGYFDFGAALQEFRGGARSAGA